MKALIVLLFSVVSCTSNSDFSQLREKWSEFLIGDSSKLKESGSQQYIAKLSERADQLMSTAITNENRKFLWKDFDLWDENPAHITRTYRNITPIVMAYNTIGTTHYQNSNTFNFITNTLDWMITNVYRSDIDYYGNWWDWQIGAAGDLVKITIMMYDDLTPDQRANYMDSIDNHINIDLLCKRHTGSNLADMGLIKILQALIINNEKLLDQTVAQVKTLYKYSTKGDGFYKDGSFIQHGNVAYTGSYGNVLISRLANIAYLLSDTKWDIINPMLYEWIYNSIEPIIYQGAVLDNVRGRSVARSYDSAIRIGNDFAESLLKIGLVADNKNKIKLDIILKSWLNGKEDTLLKGNPASILNAYTQSLSKITNVPLKDKNFAFNSMERNVHRRKDYTFALARSSTRIAKNESINNENIKPWYQGDGTVSLYMDTQQYADTYWPTVDPYQMPGVTRVVRPRNVTTGKIIMKDGQSAYVSDFFRDDVGLNEYSGSVNLGTYGSAGMKISNLNETLAGYKSWFMFDNEIVFINSKIRNNDKNLVQTTIENRRILSNSQIMVNGKNESNYEGLSKTIYINNLTSSLAYYFPTETKVSVKHSLGIGAWRDINLSDERSTTNKLTNHFAIVNHDHYDNNSLIYYLLPNISSKQLSEYDNPIEFDTDNNIHKVYHKNLNILALNFFDAGSSEYVSTDRELIYMEQHEKEGSYKVSMSDPVFSNKPLNVNIKGVKSYVVEDTDIRASINHDVLTISIDTTKDKGKIYKFTYQK